MRALAIAATLLAAGPALAGQPRSVEYFILHNGDRQYVLRTCFGGTSTLRHDAECRNANQAGYWILKAEAERGVNRFDVGNPNNPAYYSANPIARRMTLNQCDHPDGSFIQPSAQKCQAARIAAGLF